MQEGRILTPTEVNRDLLRSILEPPRWFWPVITVLGLIVLAAAIVIGVMINRGLGITNLNRPVVWGFFITNFVFWIGISHAGVMLSAILRLAKAEWRSERLDLPPEEWSKAVIAEAVHRSETAV